MYRVFDPSGQPAGVWPLKPRQVENLRQARWRVVYIGD